jgi:hypothetical protein
VLNVKEEIVGKIIIKQYLEIGYDAAVSNVKKRSFTALRTINGPYHRLRNYREFAVARL